MKSYVFIWLLIIFAGESLWEPNQAWGQTPAVEEPLPAESSEVPPEGPSPTDQAPTGSKSPQALQWALGLSFQNWSPFSEVTSNLLTEIAGASGQKTSGKNASEQLNSEEVTTTAVKVATLELTGGALLDHFKLDLTGNSDLSRINPFSSRTDQSSKQHGLESKLKNDEAQSTKLDSQLKLLEMTGLDFVARVHEENFVSSVTPKNNSLFISFVGSEALVKTSQKVQLETSFEETMTGIGKFEIPWLEWPVGFLGYFESSFQKPILLPLSKAVTYTENGESTQISNVIIFPQFAAKGMVIEWFKSNEPGFDLSGYFKWGDGTVEIGSSRNRVNALLLGSLDSSGTEEVSLFEKSAQIHYFSTMLRLSYIGEMLEASASGAVRVFTLRQHFNGVKSEKPLSVDLITSFEALYRF